MKQSRSRLLHGINVESSINSGQVFLWKRDGDMWYGVDGDRIISVDNTSKTLRIRTHVGQPRDIFRQNDNIQKIIKNISKDKQVALAVRRFPGMRLMRQEPFQCLITFITSTNSSIPNIKNALTKLCAKYGECVEYDGKKFFLFPKSKTLARASTNGLRSCSLGYRAEYVKKAAIMTNNGNLDLAKLVKAPYKDAIESLLDVPGVGNKVADCVLLFSLEKLDAFPLDRWMVRILDQNYTNKKFGQMTGITSKRYAEIHYKIVKHFGQYAGYAQQFLFKAGRQDLDRLWAVNP